MRRRGLGYVVLLVALAACNLQSPTEAPPDVLQQPTVSVPTQSNCTVNLSWVVYIVQPGDNLTDIAQRTGTTVDELSDANCLTNRDLLARGQEIRVPRLPEGATPAAGSTGCTFSMGDTIGADYVVITPSDSESIDCVRLQPGIAVTVAWLNAPPGTTEVTFWRMSARMARGDVIGVDGTPSDGFSIQWTTYAEMPPSVIYAMAGTTSDPLGVYIAVP